MFERSSPGKIGYQLPALDVPAVDPRAALGAENVRAEIAGFPEVSEVEVIRHFTRLSTWNYAIDLGMYPLGSCTMKYNPRINELVARIEGLAWAHPYQPESLSQGAMEVMAELEAALLEITGMDAITLQPAAGAHGELTGILLIRALLEQQGNPRKQDPDSRFRARHQPRHGRHRGLRGGEYPLRRARPDGSRRAGTVRRPKTWPALMVTNPNTLGVFEENHRAGRRDPASQRCAGLHGWRQHERAGRHRASRRFRRRCDAPESAQDVFHAAWRRRSGRRPGGGEEAPGAVPARAPAEAEWR